MMSLVQNMQAWLMVRVFLPLLLFSPWLVNEVHSQQPVNPIHVSVPTPDTYEEDDESASEDDISEQVATLLGALGPSIAFILLALFFFACWHPCRRRRHQKRVQAQVHGQDPSSWPFALATVMKKSSQETDQEQDDVEARSNNDIPNDASQPIAVCQDHHHEICTQGCQVDYTTINDLFGNQEYQALKSRKSKHAFLQTYLTNHIQSLQNDDDNNKISNTSTNDYEGSKLTVPIPDSLKLLQKTADPSKPLEGLAVIAYTLRSKPESRAKLLEHTKQWATVMDLALDNLEIFCNTVEEQTWMEHNIDSKSEDDVIVPQEIVPSSFLLHVDGNDEDPAATTAAPQPTGEQV